MELAGSGYLYTVALLAMTFVGFCAIVLMFRQGIKHSSRIVLHSHAYIELGFSAAAFAMLAPLLSACGLPDGQTWRIASIAIAIVMVIQSSRHLNQFVRAFGTLYPRILVNSAISALVVIGLVANASKYPFEPQLGPVAVAATWRLVHGAEIFLLTFEDFFANPTRARKSK